MRTTIWASSIPTSIGQNFRQLSGVRGRPSLTEVKSLTPLGQFRSKFPKESVAYAKLVDKGLKRYREFLRDTYANKDKQAGLLFRTAYGKLQQLVQDAGLHMSQVFPGLEKAFHASRDDYLSIFHILRAFETKTNPELWHEMSVSVSPVPATTESLDLYESTVGMTILQQMGGGGKIRAMLGANWSFLPHGLILQWPSRQRSKGNYLEVDLQPNDTYELRFFNVSTLGKKLVKKFDDVYFDSLISIFEKQTGYRLRL